MAFSRCRARVNKKMLILYRFRARRGRRRATTIERMQRLYRSSARRGRRRATIKRQKTEAIQIKGPQREGKGDNKESGRRGYTDQSPAEEREE